jgi:hypothetical protein
VSGVKTAKLQLTPQWQQTLSNYVTAVAWSPRGDWSAAATADGIVTFFAPDGEPMPIPEEPEPGPAINGLAFSADGEFCAWGGQAGELAIWDLREVDFCLQQSYGSAWLDTLAWHPAQPWLAVGVGGIAHPTRSPLIPCSPMRFVPPGGHRQAAPDPPPGRAHSRPPRVGRSLPLSARPDNEP